MPSTFDVRTLSTYGVMGLAVAGVIMLPSELIPSASAAAVVTTVTDYAVFGGTKAEIGSMSHVTGGLVGSNSTVSIGNTSVIPGVRTGNKCDYSSMSTINGDIIAASTISVGNASTVNGSLHTKDKITDGANAIINGSIYSSKDTSLGNAMRVNGNIHSGANVTSGSLAVVNGNLEIKNSWTSIATYTGYKRDKTTVPKGNPTAPLTFTAVSLPAAMSFVTGLSGDVTVASGKTMTLQPGNYGAVDIGSNCVINFAAGRYYFTSLKSGNGTRFNFDLTAGAIAIFAENDINLAANLAVYVNGTSLSMILAAAKGGTMTVAGKAADVYVETHGKFKIGNTGTWFGAVYAPNDLIELGANAMLVGSIISGTQAKLGNTSDLFYVPWSGTLPPELAAIPSSEGAYD